MMPVKTVRSKDVYGAPPGLEDKIGGLPYWRTQNDFGTSTIWSEWKPSDNELRILNEGGQVLVGIVGEPIHPMSVSVTIKGGDPEDESMIVHSHDMPHIDAG
jgi:hypothetical protein